ncbi:DgyrCDS5278 [Dimorphilus gyrociliatus]|uniref:DgyrCDS5278 n=1 Tax=Dimorphilus gyrociliatus TaxID=2664684 RepID=A0A7I8VK27_9ANNE|nr:DgyrCDS5278 [Dimorphilus gyrociliatus]
MDVNQEILKKLLNRDKIKLWEEPYTLNDGELGILPEELCSKYAAETNLKTEILIECLENLRQHSYKKFIARKKFQETGVACLDIKITDEANIVKTEQYEINLNNHAIDLKQKIASKLGKDIYCLKMICSGRLIENDLSLRNQGVQNFSQIMVLIVPQSVSEAEKSFALQKDVQMTRATAEFLADHEAANANLDITDQNGKRLKLPEDEKRSLILAMSLQEKGRTVLKRKEYSHSLMLLLESDAEFKKCRSELLQVADNYANLCLDIVWCYLCLKSIKDLPDAKQRLEKCELCFRKSYGPNLERLSLLKGSTGNEKALYMRLHLMQGILAFHQGFYDESKCKLSQAQNEWSKLHVEDSKLTEVMSMGFTEREARLCLRDAEGNMNIAVEKIMQKREKKRMRQIEADKEDEERKLEKLLGKTVNDIQINATLYKQLKGIGIPNGAAKEALRITNNNFDKAIQILQEKRNELYFVPDPEFTEDCISTQMIEQLTNILGEIDEKLAKSILTGVGGSIEKAVEGIMEKGLGHFACKHEASTSKQAEKDENKEMKKRIYEDLLPDISRDAEDYLDLTLEEEAKFLEEYTKKLSLI